MAMVTLHSILAPDMNLHGIIPAHAVCFPRPAQQLLTLHEAAKRSGDPTLLKDEGVEVLANLQRLYSGGVTLRGFMEAQAEWAQTSEWSLGCNGCLVHWVGPVMAGPVRIAKVLELDVSQHLKGLDDLSLLRLAAHAFDGWRDERTDPRDFFTAELVEHVVDGRHPGHSERRHFLEKRARDRVRETRLYATLGRRHPDPASEKPSPLGVITVHGVRGAS